MSIANVISLLGGVALFLFGMSFMGEGLKKVAGNKLEMILWKLSSNPLKGVLLGTVVTAVIQSSSATTVMVVGFVNSGMMKVAQAIGVIMGANIGTSITGWILCLSNIEGAGSAVALLSTATLAAVIALIGIIMRMFSKSSTKKYIGEIMLGFAVLMYGMQSMSSAVAPLKESESFTAALTMFSNPFLGILIGILITAVLQSASASVGILQALSMTGAISFATALPIIMGMGIGAAVPVLLSAIGANKNGKRTALVYLFNDLFGAIIWSVVFYSLNAVFKFTFMDVKMNAVGIAMINSVFRMATVCVLFPFIKYIEKLVNIVIRDDPDDVNETADIALLEERFLAHPSLAIQQSRVTVCSMAAKSLENFNLAVKLLGKYSESGFKKVVEKEDAVDKYEDRLGTYLVKVTGRELNHSQTKDISKFLHTISDFERISDHALNIAKVAKEMKEKSAAFSDDAKKELEILINATREIIEISVKAFSDDDPGSAFKVEPLEELIDSICDEMKLRHIERVQQGSCTLEQGFMFNDLITAFERTADHCSNIAVAIIEIELDSFNTHEYLNGVKKAKLNYFEDYYNEFKEKYSL